MNIEDLTLKELKMVNTLFSSESDSLYKIGEQYFIRTATFYCTGKVIAKTSGELELENASWIADSGRLNNALLTGEFAEIEPFPENLIVNINSIIDATVFPHVLPSTVK